MERDGIYALRNSGHLNRQILVLGHLKVERLKRNGLQGRLFERPEKERGRDMRGEHAVGRMHTVVETRELLDKRRLESRFRALELDELCAVLRNEIPSVEEDPDGERDRRDENHDGKEEQ